MATGTWFFLSAVAVVAGACDSGTLQPSFHADNFGDLVASLLLEGKDSWARKKAAEDLGKTRSKEAIGPLSKAFTQGEDLALRKVALKALGKIGGPEAVELLSQALQDKDPGVRVAAVEAFAIMGGTEAIKALSRVLQHRNEIDSVRAAAEKSLSSIRRDLKDRLEVWSQSVGFRLHPQVTSTGSMN
mmetsp:Transcript_70570/g.216219  ORF Transcript_70570/g.216219 Transcript_70570/m.216219 type:complete len:187 (-) Transcript_70570:23-583(-)|eukprot:CAMPEP_0198545354 /NCGR_PEP_ID=MMETSP1462-20131121/63809_1 /TAXON_ID=1333877 /ORGANISM="Brandtodinium nutriculum, Strain RCC3387" /LENGTH=186 /DNA_ID=CAMNT_0044275733 /DNA_START=65 /DNA_END=625 /DNA_ORIENTATION=+